MNGFTGKKLGCIHTPKERLAKVPRLFDAKYNLPSTLPLIPDSTDYAVAFNSQLIANGCLGNDRYGDCVIVATFANAPGTQAANATGTQLSFTAQQILDLYAKITGFNPEDPSTDQGTDPVVALQYAKENGYCLAWGQVDITSPTEMAAAINLFGGIVYATDVPEAWESARVWEVSDSQIVGGHGVVLPSYRLNGNYDVETWGELVQLTPAAVAKYGQAAYGFITKYWFESNQQSLQGFDLAQLQADLVLV